MRLRPVRRRWQQGLCGLVALFCLFPAPTWANLGPPSYGGQVTAEPIGIENVEITRETLTIDLRPVAKKEPAQVDAIYHLRNDGQDKELDLLFALGTLDTEDFQVWLNDQPVASQPAPATDLPSSWQPPEHTPGLNHPPLDYLRYSYQIAPRTLSVTIPPGKQDLKVNYSTQTATHLQGKPTIYHQFAYILAPARSWSVFGGIDITIHLPLAWQVATTPPLIRKGDNLTGAFTELPGDAIALTMQAPAGWAYRPMRWGTQILLGLTWIGGLGLGWRLGRRQGRQLATQQPPRIYRQVWPWSLGFGLIWGMAILAIGWLAIYSPDWVLPAGQVSRYGYGQGFALLGVMGLSLLSVAIGGIVLLVAATRSRQVKGVR